MLCRIQTRTSALEFCFRTLTENEKVSNIHLSCRSKHLGVVRHSGRKKLMRSVHVLVFIANSGHHQSQILFSSKGLLKTFLKWLPLPQTGHWRTPGLCTTEFQNAARPRCFSSSCASQGSTTSISPTLSRSTYQMH